MGNTVKIAGIVMLAMTVWVAWFMGIQSDVLWKVCIGGVLGILGLPSALGFAGKVLKATFKGLP